MIVRRLLFSQGYRYRVHYAPLPGKPDIVFTRKRKVIFVHGCFWHQHPSPNCPYVMKPRSNTGYWKAKLERNVARDREHIQRLKELGWDTLIVWECQTLDPTQLTRRLADFLAPQYHAEN
jgi:DNA mismatch endonuclease (patch repair protein)